MGVIRSRRILALAAFAALAAWANVQAMACCVMAAEPAVAEAPMAADHSCCPGNDGAAAADANSNANAEDAPAHPPGCGMERTDAATLCCASGEVAAVSATTVAPADAGLAVLPVASAWPAVSSAASGPPWHVASSPPDGAPPFLSYQRLLI